MSRKKKIFISLVVIVGVLYLSFGNPRKETRTAISVIAGGLAIAWIIQHEGREIDERFRKIDNRFRRIENSLGLLYDADEKEQLSRPVSYKISLGLLPHWEDILKKLADQNKQQPDEFLEAIFKDQDLGIKKRECLFGKDFWFVIFNDEISGMQQVWSNQHKNFVDCPEVYGRIFEPWPLLGPGKYATNLVSKHLTLNPRRAGFDAKDGDIANIPYSDILRLLLDLGKYTYGGAEYAIKEFPEQLKKKLQENNVRYDNNPWSFRFKNNGGENSDKVEHGLNNDEWLRNKGAKLYQQGVDQHVFHTPYYSVSISLEIFTSSLSNGPHK